MCLAPFLFLAAAVSLPGADPPRKAFPLPFDQHDFPNGLRLITIPTDYPNVVALYIVVQTGSRNEVEPGKSGFAHLFEHMMFRGTKAFPPDRYEAAIKQAGAASNAYTTDDHTAYHTTFSKEDLEAILRMEADRFQNLEYQESVFRTETQAVLGEYNKNSAAPTSKLFEVLRATAFDTHTYRHTTMGFLKDIEDMPNQFDYSRLFFDRYYRPEYTTIILAGDLTAQTARGLVERYWSGWKRGSYKPAVPSEPPQRGARRNHIDWPTPTLPWLAVSYRGPAYSDTQAAGASLDLIASLGFSPNSALYQKLVIEEQKVDILDAENADRLDPYLFTILARVKKAADLEYVEQQILATLEGFREKEVEAARLGDVKSNLRYSFALRMDNSETIAATVARYVALRRTPETINRVFELYDRLSPAELRRAAGTYLTEDGRTTVTLTGGKAK